MQKTLKIDQIKPNPDNPRIIKDDKFKKLVKSLQEFPEMTQIRRVVVNKDLMILGGNMRWRAAKEAGWTDIPVEIVDLPEDKQREFIIKDNVSGGEWDWDTLANEWSKEQLEDWGVDIENWTSDEVVEDDVPDLDDTIKPESKLGEVYQLGRHRLMCGDATKIEDVEKLMDGKKADIIITDPPYGIGYEYNEHDDSDNEANANLVSDVFNLHSCGKVWTCGLHNLARDISRFGKTKIAIWYKKFAMAGSGLGGASTWEPIIILNPPVKKLKNDVIETMTDRETIGQKSLRELHSCPKPVSLYAELVSSFTYKENIILEPFCGSGSTLIACEQTNRICYGMEIDPKYVDVIRKRYHKFITGSEEGWIEATPVIK
jgi:DNA modification methylase